MELDQAIRTRRTHKVFRPDPVNRATLEELFELARWVPNHRLTNPWRFRVLGPKTLEALKHAADRLEPGSGRKLERAPTLVVSSAQRSEDPVQGREDLLAAAIASYVVLLGAHDRGLAGYWRTPAILRDPAGLAAVDVGEDEEILGLLHLGYPRQEQAPPERAPLETIVSYLP